MRIHHQEKETLEQALIAFRKGTGLRITVEELEAGFRHDWQVDAAVRIAGRGMKARFFAEVKRALTTATIGTAVDRLRRLPEKAILVADYVNPNLAEKLKQMDVPFIDTAGNVYLNEPPLLLYIKGQGPLKTLRRARPARAFQPTGLKVIFAFLCKPELFMRPYREVAQAAGVALGTVGWVINDLRTLGFVVEMGQRGRKLTQKENLLERWVAGYAERLRPKLLIGRFEGPDADWWRRAHLGETDAYWGGEVAAARLTDYLKPELITIYAREKPARLLLKNKLKENATGNTEILRVFWQPECNWEEKELVNPLLVYADLLATGDPRNIEVARIIYEQRLAGFVRES
jgi:hypothetical protein